MDGSCVSRGYVTQGLGVRSMSKGTGGGVGTTEQC